MENGLNMMMIGIDLSNHAASWVKPLTAARNKMEVTVLRDSYRLMLNVPLSVEAV